LYYSGRQEQARALLPLFCAQIAALAKSPSPLQPLAAALASQAYQLASELAADREDFGVAQQVGQQALLYGQLAGDTHLQVSALIRQANTFFHRKQSTYALHAFQQALPLLEKATPLLCGRAYAGIAHAMRNELVEELIIEGEAKAMQNRTGSPSKAAKPARGRAKQAAERKK
jgi:hypothetical protein